MRLVLILLVLAAAGAARADALTPAEAREEVALVRRAMDYAYPGFGRFAERAEFDAALDAIAADPPADSDAMYAALAGAAARLKDSHLVMQPASAITRRARRAAVYAPWRCDIRNGRLFATEVTAAAQAAGLAPGDEVLSVDGVAAADYLAAARALVAQDGDNDRARDAQLCGGGGDFSGSDLDHYSAMLFPSAADQALTVRTGEGAERAVSAPRITLDGLIDAFGGAWAERGASARRDILYLPLSAEAAYLRVGSFQTGPDGPRILSRAFEDMFARGTRALILDLRGNGGGSSLMALTLLRYLAEERVQLITLAQAAAEDFAPIADIAAMTDERLLEPGLFAPFAGGGWRAHGPEFDGMLAPHPPLQPGFRGDLYVLIDPLTDSNAALVAARLKRWGAGTLIGEMTGGSAQGPVGGMFAFVALPHSGHSLRIPLLRQYAQSAGDPGHGVAPDIEMRPELADLAAGRDPVLTRALSLARIQMAGPAPVRPGTGRSAPLLAPLGPAEIPDR